MNKENHKELKEMLIKQEQQYARRALRNYESSKQALQKALNKGGIADDVLYLAASTFCDAYELADELGTIKNKLLKDDALDSIMSGKLFETEDWQELKTGLVDAKDFFKDEDDEPCDCEDCTFEELLAKLKGEPWRPSDDELMTGIEFGTTKDTDGYAFHASVKTIRNGIVFVDAKPGDGCEKMTDGEFRAKVRSVLQDFHPDYDDEHIKVKIVR